MSKTKYTYLTSKPLKYSTEMEVGAVKQAFNNEVIQLKKNLNQAKIQIIHKLTRKAKTLTEKKAPDHLKEKNKRKAESAVKEVLIMKKIKPRDIARFIITFKGELNSQLNKPVVDSDKVCARLLLHRSLQQKYKSIKDKFGDIPIKDLLMSRQERRKLKKEAKEAQKSKKKGKVKNEVVNAEGSWDVEDVVMGDGSKDKDSDESDNEGADNISEGGDQDDEEISDDETLITRQVVNGSDESSDGEAPESDLESDDDDADENMEKDESSNEEQRKDDEEIETEKIENPNLAQQIKPTKAANIITKPVHPVTIEDVLSKLKPKKIPEKKVKDSKNKNLKEKMLNRKFKKDSEDSKNTAKVVDPFFITASGENYLTVAEPRQPDEVKEVHRQGNRQERRAAMFGRAPIRPRRNDRQNDRLNKFNRNDTSNNFNGNDRRAKFNDRNSFNGKDKNKDINSNFNERNSSFNDRNAKFNDRSSNFNDRNSNNKFSEPKEEKLHPSWEAKKKQSGILPFKGKKIVFDEN